SVHDIGAGRHVDGTPETTARDLQIDPSARRVRLQFDLQLELASDRPDGNLDDGVDVRRIMNGDVDHVRHAPADLVGIGDERPHGVWARRYSLFAVVLKVHGSARLTSRYGSKSASRPTIRSLDAKPSALAFVAHRALRVTTDAVVGCVMI